MKLLDPINRFAQSRTFWHFEDFFEYVTADLWTLTATDSGTALLSDAHAGVIALTPSDGTVADNDEVYLKSTKELFLFADDKPAVFVARVKYAEANTDDANVCFGFMNAVAANSILDDGGGPAASYSGAVFYKVDGGTVWNVESSNAGTQTTTATAHTAGGADWHEFKIEVNPISSTKAEVIFYFDNVQCLDANNRPIKHELTLTSLTEMQVFFGMKNGAATNVETLNIDFAGFGGVR